MLDFSRLEQYRENNRIEFNSHVTEKCMPAVKLKPFTNLAVTNLVKGKDG